MSSQFAVNKFLASWTTICAAAHSNYPALTSWNLIHHIVHLSIIPANKYWVSESLTDRWWRNDSATPGPPRNKVHFGRPVHQNVNLRGGSCGVSVGAMLSASENNLLMLEEQREAEATRGGLVHSSFHFQTVFPSRVAAGSSARVTPTSLFVFSSKTFGTSETTSRGITQTNITAEKKCIFRRLSGSKFPLCWPSTQYSDARN